MTASLDIDQRAVPLARQLAAQLAAAGAVRSPAWHRAFASVPRHVFAPAFWTVAPRPADCRHLDGARPADRDEWLATVYRDEPLVTQFNQAGTATSSSTTPSLMALMLEAAELRDGANVLEVGTGTGYNAALLCHRLGDQHVTTVEIDPELTGPAAAALERCGYEPAVITGDGLAGYPPRAPFDAIIGTCATARVPAAWLAQTRPGGTVVANVGYGVAPLRVADDGSATGRYVGDIVGFIESRTADGAVTTVPIDQAVTAVTGPAGGEHVTTPRPDTLADDEFLFFHRIIVPSVMRFSLTDDDGAELRCLYDPPTGSWARAHLADDGAEVTQHGPRRLWSELLGAHTRWTSAGRPSHDRLGLTVHPDGGHLLWVDQPDGPRSWPLAAVVPLKAANR
jgi:methyltransferase of ATP-grasp peptide maturase system